MDYIVQKTQRKLKLKKKDAPIPISVKSIHKQKLKYFEDLQNSLPKKRELFLKTRDRILEKEIKDIENMVEETDYYFKVAKILDKYFSLENENTETDNSKKIEIVRDYYQALDIDLPRARACAVHAMRTAHNFVVRPTVTVSVLPRTVLPRRYTVPTRKRFLGI